MVTYRQVREARPAAWRDAAGGWRRLAAALAVRAESTDGVRAGIAAHWRGAAAVAGLAALGALSAALRAARGPALACDQALCEHASEVERIQLRLAALPSPQESPPESAPGVAGLVSAASASDEQTRARLVAAAEAFDVHLGAHIPGGTIALPASGAAPVDVRRWWDGLSPGERAMLLAARPRELGALDGVPVAVRDAANRLVLDQLLATMKDGERRRALRALADRLDRAGAGGSARAYLIALDPSGDGRAVVAVGDPDRAAHVVTHVPGAGADLGDLRGLLARTDRLARAASGGGSVSAVLWLGYDAPEGLSATGPAAARRGAVDLDRFQEGLRATATGPPAQHTVVGHSYGSLVVGTAAQRHGLPVDDLVFVGSPGVGADHARQLGVPGGHVWSSTARFDAIRAAALADRRLEWLDPDVGLDRWHGANPDDPRFGGRTFTSQPGNWFNPLAAHNAYFDEGSSSLTAIGAIIRGDYASVR